MATTTKRIQRIQGPISALNAGQIGVENTADSDLGFKMYGGKDPDGVAQKFLAKDKPAQVKELTVTDLTAGIVVTDANGAMSTGTLTRQAAYDGGQSVDVTGPEHITRVLAGGAPIAEYHESQLARMINSTGSGVDDFEQIVRGGSGGILLQSVDVLNLQDVNLTSPIPISETGETGLDTTAQSIIGAINEVQGRLRDIDIDYTAASDATLAILSHGVTDGECGSIEADIVAASAPGTDGAAFYHIAASWWYDGTLVIGEAQIVRTPWAPATNAAYLDADEVVTVTASGSNILINFALKTGARVVGHYNVLSVTIPEPPA